jgi:hypothetical protein
MVRDFRSVHVTSQRDQPTEHPSGRILAARCLPIDYLKLHPRVFVLVEFSTGMLRIAHGIPILYSESDYGARDAQDVGFIRRIRV